MGKVKTKKFKVKKQNPTGEIIEAATEVIPDTVEEFISSIVFQLQCKQTEEKCSACNKLAELSDGKKMSSVLESEIPRILAPMMAHPNKLVQHTAAGALRNLSVAGGLDGCEKLVDSDIMTPLVHVFKTYGTDWTLSKSCVERNRLDTQGDTFLQSCYLLFNLSESSDTCIKIFNSEKLLPVFIRCLDFDKFTKKLAIAVAHCLHVISEDNTTLSSDLEEWMGTLDNILGNEENQADMILLKVLVAGIVLNVSKGKLDEVCGSRIKMIMKVLSEALTLTYSDSATVIINTTEVEDGLEIQNKELSAAVEVIENTLTAKQIALEILANICSNYDDDGCCYETEDSSSSEGIYQDQDDDNMGDEQMNSSALSLNSLPVQIEEALLSEDLVKNVISLIKPTEEPLIKQLKESQAAKHLLPRFELLTCRSLSCFHNMVTGLSISDLGGSEFLYNIWISLGESTFNNSGPDNLKLLDSSTSVLRAVLQKIVKSENYAQLKTVTSHDLQMICQSGLKCLDPSVRVNIIRILGIFGSLFAQIEDANFDDHLKCIGVIFLTMCHQDSDLWVVGETLDSIFDVFAEDHTDRVAQQIGLVDKLRNILPQFKNKMKLQRKKIPGEHWMVLTTARDNLKRFLEYKSSLVTKTSNGCADT